MNQEERSRKIHELLESGENKPLLERLMDEWTEADEAAHHRARLSCFMPYDEPDTVGIQTDAAW